MKRRSFFAIAFGSIATLIAPRENARDETDEIEKELERVKAWVNARLPYLCERESANLTASSLRLRYERPDLSQLCGSFSGLKWGSGSDVRSILS
jgi:hypothetical protein